MPFTLFDVVQVDLSCNLLLELPEEFGKLKDLKVNDYISLFLLF